MELEGVFLQAASQEPVFMHKMGGRVVVTARNHPVGAVVMGAAVQDWKKNSVADGLETIPQLNGPDLCDMPATTDMMKHGVMAPLDKQQLLLEAASCKAVPHKRSQKKKDLSGQSFPHKGPITTLMIRHIPCSITLRQLADVVAELGYGGKFDLLFMPTAHRPSASGNSNLGYAFVNFTHAADAASFPKAIEGYKFQGTASVKVCTAQPAHVQGFDNTLGQLMRQKKPSESNFLFSF